MSGPPAHEQAPDTTSARAPEYASNDASAPSNPSSGPQLAPHHTSAVIPTLPYVLAIHNLPVGTSHKELRDHIHVRLPAKDIADNIRFHILDLDGSEATVEFASSVSAQAVASSLNGLELQGSTIECSMVENPALVSVSESDGSATPTPPASMGSVNPFFYMPSMYPVDYGYFGVGSGPYSYPTAPNPMPSAIPMPQHPAMHYVHSVPNMGGVQNMQNMANMGNMGPMMNQGGMPPYPQTPSYPSTPYGFYGMSEAPMGYGYGSTSSSIPGSNYGSSHNSSRRSSTKSSGNFSRARSSRTSSLSLNRQNSTNSFRRSSNGSRASSMSGPARTSSNLSMEQFGPQKPLPGGSSLSLSVPEAPEREDAPDDEIDPNDESGMAIVEDENGQPVRVNPLRLFVGNIPFTSTWPALKNFLKTKAEEIEPNNDIEILKVEIPMQQARDSGEPSAVGSYYYLASLSQQLQNGPGGQTTHRPPPPHHIEMNTNSPRHLSRGFAIVTTGNRASSEKLIRYFNNVEFENRPMTVRFDRYPNFNKYTLQQLHPSGRKPSYGSGAKNKPGFLTNLAFERNSFQQNYYYGCAPQYHAIAPPYLSGQMYPQNRNFTSHRVRAAPRATSDTPSSGTEDQASGAGIEGGEESEDQLQKEKPACDAGPAPNVKFRNPKPKMSMSDLGPPLTEIEQGLEKAPTGRNEEDAVTARELVDFVGDASQ